MSPLSPASTLTQEKKPVINEYLTSKCSLLVGDLWRTFIFFVDICKFWLSGKTLISFGITDRRIKRTNYSSQSNNPSGTRTVYLICRCIGLRSIMQLIDG